MKRVRWDVPENSIDFTFATSSIYASFLQPLSIGPDSPEW
jgi:hypothetical protein